MPGTGSSPRVQRTIKSIKALEASVHRPEELQPATKKAAQKLTNFRAYLHKSSVAGCFVDLLEITSEGVMTEAGLYPSSRYKKHRSMRQAGLGGRGPRSRPPTGLHNHSNSNSQAPGHSSLNQTDDQHHHHHQQRGRGRRRPSTALETPTPPLLAHAPDAPLTSRDAGGRFAGAGGGRALAFSPRNRYGGDGYGGGGYGGGRGGRVLSAAAAAAAATSPTAAIAGGSSSSRVTTLEVQRTQWVEGDHGRVKGGDWVEEGAAGYQVGGDGEPETNEEVEHEERVPRVGGGGRGDSSARRRSSVSTASSEPPSAPRLAWGKAMREVTSSVDKVTQLKVAAHRAITHSADERRRRAFKARAELIEEEKLRAQELLYKNANRKQMAVAAAALAASQRGLLEAITLVLATKRLWAEGQKLSRQRNQEVELGKSARIVQRAFKAYTSRKMLKVLLAIRKVQLKLTVGISIRRKRMAVKRMVWFLTTGNGGAKARPRKVIRAFMYQVRRCQRAAREWLACRAASIEAVCRLWDRIESEIRRGLGDELDRAKRVWMKNALRTGEDSHVNGQWRELKAKTRSLVARIDRLEAEIERQQKRDKAARLLAARSTLKRRQPHGLDGVTRGHKRVAQQMDSAENLRSSTVPSSKRLAIIRSNLNTKFSLHLQGGSRRVERTGNRVIGEMDARLLIQGEFPDAPPDDDASEGGTETGTGTAAPPAARSTKISRGLIYTGDLGRSWQQIVEDTVMQDFRKNAFARKDSMPYLKYSAVLSLDMLAATSNFDGPSAAFAAASAAAESAGGANTNNIDSNNSSALLAVDGRGVRASSGSGSGSGSPSTLERRRRPRQESSGAGGGPARLMLEPIL